MMLTSCSSPELLSNIPVPVAGNEALIRSMATMRRLLLLRCAFESPTSILCSLLPELQEILVLKVLHLARYVEAKYDFLAEVDKGTWSFIWDSQFLHLIILFKSLTSVIEMSMEEGEKAEVLWKSGEWWYAVKKNGDHGYIPKSYLLKSNYW